MLVLCERISGRSSRRQWGGLDAAAATTPTPLNTLLSTFVGGVSGWRYPPTHRRPLCAIIAAARPQVGDDPNKTVRVTRWPPGVADGISMFLYFIFLYEVIDFMLGS